MKLFTCQNCTQLIYFENIRCERCCHSLRYLADRAVLSGLTKEGEGWSALAATDGRWRLCANAAYAACNWLVAMDSPDAYCLSCRHNRTIPDLSVPANLIGWQKIELAKRRLFYSMLQLGLPLRTRGEDRAAGLAFDFLADPSDSGDQARIMTGHDNA
jgi:hypothetical protein